MKNEILKILDSYAPSAIKKLPLAKGELYLIGEREQTIAELTALMCSQAVKAIFGYTGSYYINMPSVYNKIYKVLIVDYPPQLVIACLEKFKNEQYKNEQK